MILAITEELGRFEEFFSEVIYPVWPVWLAGAVIGLAAIAWVAVRLGWHETALQHRFITGAAIVLILAVTIPAGYYTISPLFDRETVCEASPIPGAGAGSEDCEGVVLAAGSPTPAATDAADETAAPTEAPATDAPATEAPTDAAFEPQVVAEGTFEGADDFHFGEGTALLIETEPGVYVLRFEDFSVRNGPDLFVYLSPDPDGYADDALNLGGLKGTDGAFNYDVPPGTDISQFESAVVWCEDFAVLFATATFGS